MKTYKLSILIPARNEQFLSRTVEDILQNKRGDTEIIVGLDGQWAEPGIPDHPDVRIVYVSESVGQRALTNKLARLSSAKYVAKTDAHCAFDEGFDVKMMDSMQDDWTMVPTMKNLHAFNWVCDSCSSTRYQGPSGPCTNCGAETRKDVIWYAKPSPNSTTYCFDNTLHFQYFNEFKKRPEGQGDITPTMSLQGSFFMMTREKYWELNICDEGHGSWGQQGVEVACKTWLSGGQVMVNQTTWYAHMFRTQGGDFGFPYDISNRDVEKARNYSRDLWFNGKWPLAKHSLKWLIEKFAPVPTWTQLEINKISGEKTGDTRGILYFTDNELPIKLAKKVQYRIRQIAEDKGMELVSSTRKPMDKMGKNVVTREPRGYLTMFKQILKGLEAMESDIVFMAEHDVLYPPEHFDYVPQEKGKVYYDINWWKVREDGFAVHWDADQVSGMCAYREDLIDFYKDRVANFDKDNFDRKFEPFSGEKSVQWKASVPHIDIRHNRNLTYNKWSLEHFRKKETAVNFTESNVDNIEGWDKNDII